MKNMTARAGVSVMAALLLTFFYACTKNAAVQSGEPGPDQNKLSVYLTDGPGYFDQVMVDIRGIAVKVDTSQHWWDNKSRGSHHRDHENDWSNKDRHDRGAIWDTLDISPGVYDLLNFANGADTLLTSANIPKGRVIAFRFTMGDDNSLVKDSVSYPLHLLPGWKNIYVRVYGASFEKIASDHFKIWIDFDAGRSVIRVRNGLFYLRPVLRAFAISNTGSVAGRVVPGDALPVVSVYNDTDTLYAIPEHHGMFRVRGLPEGTYSVFINASGGYADTTLTGVDVKAGQTDDVGVIRLHQ